mgnify:CR=1 FL=1
MNTVGIIAEYNPFHNGHIHQIETIRARYPQARIIVLMSGSFTQRGCPAILDKWQRASHAVLGGASLVLELPAVFAVRSAQDFARGGVQLLSRLGVADGLAFGTESDGSLLAQAAQCIDSPDVQEALHRQIRQGKSYAAALSHALTEKTGLEEACFKKPNNILALEYIRSLKHLATHIRPLPCKRSGAAYHDNELHAPCSSAGAIRREFSQPAPREALLSSVLPPASLNALLKAWKNHALPQASLLFRPLLTCLSTLDAKALEGIYNINEGLENRLYKAAAHSRNLDELISESKSRRYPASRIQRLLIYVLLHLRWQDILSFDTYGPLYARILAFNSEGRSLLHEIKEKGTLPLVSKTSGFLHSADMKRPPQERSPLQNMLACDIRATELRSICLSDIAGRGDDFLRSPLCLC